MVGSVDDLIRNKRPRSRIVSFAVGRLLWRLRAKEAWELFRRQPGHKQTTKEKFAQEFKRRVTNMVDGPVGSKAREKYLLEWMSELRKSAKGMECDKTNDQQWSRVVPDSCDVRTA